MHVGQKRALIMAVIGGLVGCGGSDSATFAEKISNLLPEIVVAGPALRATLEEADAVARSPVSGLSPSGLARVPALPLPVTGNIDINREGEGEQASFEVDVDGDGAADSLTLLSAGGQVLFGAWAGDAAGWDDAGLCYLAFNGLAQRTLLIAAACEAQDGALVCNYFGSAHGQCVACNVDGGCSVCEEGELCAWAAPQSPGDTGSVSQRD